MVSHSADTGCESEPPKQKRFIDTKDVINETVLTTMHDANEPRIRDLLSLLTAGFVDHMQDVKVNVDKSHRGYNITMKVNMADQRKIIGAGGKNSSAIQSVLRTFLNKLGERLDRFHVMEPTVGQASDSYATFMDEDWTKDKSNDMARLFENTILYLDENVKVTASDEVHGETKIRIQPSYDYSAATIMALSDIFRASAKVRGRRVVLKFYDADEAGDLRHGTLPH